MDNDIPKITYINEKFIVPEVDDDELLQFSLAFMEIQKREYKPNKNLVKKRTISSDTT